MKSVSSSEMDPHFFLTVSSDNSNFVFRETRRSARASTSSLVMRTSVVGALIKAVAPVACCIIASAYASPVGRTPVIGDCPGSTAFQAASSYCFHHGSSFPDESSGVVAQSSTAANHAAASSRRAPTDELEVCVICMLFVEMKHGARSTQEPCVSETK